MRSIPAFLRQLLLIACFCFVATSVANAQDDPLQARGIVPWGSYQHGDIDSVNTLNGSLSLHIPLYSLPQRGQLSLSFSLVSNSAVFSYTTYLCQSPHTYCYVVVNNQWLYPNLAVDQAMYASSSQTRYPANSNTFYNVYSIKDGSGTTHQLGYDNTNLQLLRSTDGSGLLYQPVTNPSDTPFLPSGDYGMGTVYTPTGIQHVHTSTGYTIRDSDGNSIGFSQNAQVQITDSIGRTLPSTPTAPSSSITGCPVVTANYQPTTTSSTWTVPGPNSTQLTYLFCYATVYIHTDFVGGCLNHPILCPNNVDFDGTFSLLQSIVLPNGTYWTFTYDAANPSSSTSYAYGDLTQIKLPSGGTISYQYVTAGASCEFNPNNSPAPSMNRAVSRRTFDPGNGGQPYSWTYAYATTPSTTTTITDGQNNDTVYSFSGLGTACGLYETQHQSYQGSHTTGTLLLTKATTYQFAATNPQSGTWTGVLSNIGVLPTTVRTTLDNGQATTTTYQFNDGGFVDVQPACTVASGNSFTCTYSPTQQVPFGLKTSASITDYGGTTLKTVQTQYLYQQNASYKAANFLDQAASVTTLSGSGTQVAKITYGYDENNGSPQGIFGHQTSVSRWLNTNGTYMTSMKVFNTQGMVTQSIDPLSNASSYTYDSTGTLPAKVQLADTTQNSLTTHHIANYTHDQVTGKPLTYFDQNSLQNSYSYDDMSRLTTINFPDGGQETHCYTDEGGPSCIKGGPPYQIVETKKINSSQTRTQTKVSDGLGRVSQTQLNSDPQGTIYVDTAYDAAGRIYTISNPYRSGNDPTTARGTTTLFYDALGRKCLEVPPDGTLPTGGVCPATQPANDLFTTYSGNTATVTDQTGKSRKSVTDSLGRLTQVFEDPSGLNYETDYQYDALGNLLCVGQKGTSSGTFTNCATIPAGWRARNFTYDSLSRLLSSSNPEVGTITYTYDSDANCPGTNTYLGLLVSKTDARGIRTCYQYDSVNREIARYYSNGDPSVTTTYDQPNCLGLATCQNVGHRTNMIDAAGSESWSYQVDSANSRAIHREQRTTNSITKSSTYYTDLAYNLTQAVYPTGRVVNYTYDNANRPATAADGSNGTIYVTDFQTAPTGCLAGAVCYTPQSTFYALSIGQTSSFTGLNLTHSYNSRLQPNEFKASSTSGNAIDITYGFVDPVTSHNAGHVYSITNNLDTTRSQTFTYDSLNRITSALTASTHATSSTHCWGETYTLDAWANLNSIAGTTNSNYTGCSQESGFSTTADGNNHLPSFSYDASGNTQNDGVNSYTWDAESQLKTAAGVTYTYDGDGRRVSKVGSKLYWYGSGGDILAETDASGNTTAEYIFFGGKRVAMSFPGTGLPGTGSATVNGSEQSITGAPAASGTGSVTFSGTLQSKQVLSHAATSGTGTISISGGPDQSTSVGYVCGPNGQMCWRTVYDSGSISVTVNGFPASAGYYQASGWGSIATDLATALNASGSPVTASSGSSGVSMTAKATGAASNYSVSISVSYDSNDFSHASFTASGPSALTGGANATYTTVYDSGTDTITVNGHADTVSWSGSGTTNSSIASALASSINADSAASVSASASGGIVSLTAKTTGASTNYSLSSSSTYDSADFTSASFTSSNSGSALTGGRDAGATVYDSGNVWVTINGTQYSVSYGQGSSSSSIASGLASAISAGSLANAIASGSSISITSKSNGAAANYSLSSGSSTSQGSFSSASFTASTSGSTLTGGSGGIFYYVEDLLGTSRVMTTNTGVVCYDADFYPYGGERSYTNTCPQNYKFEGKERDTETGNDDFGARYYSNRFGRWLSADWSSTPVAVPYANLTNPQTLNLYAMVADDPESFADLDGHSGDDDGPPAPFFPNGPFDGCSPMAKLCDGPGKKDPPPPADPNAPINVVKDIPGVGKGLNWLVDGDKIALASRDLREAETIQGKIGEGTALLLLVGINLVPGAGKAAKGTAKAEEVLVYEIVEHGKTVYVGITNNLGRRGAQHGAQLIPALERTFTRKEARAVEQALIEHFGLQRKAGGQLRNLINSISPTRNPEGFKKAVAWGKSLLESGGYHF